MQYQFVHEAHLTVPCPHAVPDPVLGGVTTFLFASVATSGLRVLSYIEFTRRDRFILAAVLSFGVGDLLVPTIFTHLFDGVDHPNNALQGFFDSITIVLSTPFLVAGLVAAILNLILPQEDKHEDDLSLTAEMLHVETGHFDKEKEM